MVSSITFKFSHKRQYIKYKHRKTPTKERNNEKNDDNNEMNLNDN